MVMVKDGGRAASGRWWRARDGVRWVEVGQRRFGAGEGLKGDGEGCQGQ